MKIDIKKFELAMSNACMTFKELAKKSGVSSFTISRMQTKAEIKPVTIGKIAKALQVPVTDIIETTAATVNQEK